MSPVIYQPPPWHGCQPPTRQTDYDGSGTPLYAPDTIWACDDCGRRWIVASEVYDEPVDLQPAGTRAKFRRLVRTWWERHDKDTP